MVERYGPYWIRCLLGWRGCSAAAHKIPQAGNLHALYATSVETRSLTYKACSCASPSRRPEGDIEVLNTFWHLPPDAEEPDLVPPILIYADLLTTLDPRNIETAKMIRDKYINDVLLTA